MEDNNFSPENIRDVIGGVIGKTVVEVTQMDPEEWQDGEDPYIMLMFSDGGTLKLVWPCHGTMEYFDPETGDTYGLHLMSEEDLDLIEEDEDEEFDA